MFKKTTTKQLLLTASCAFLIGSTFCQEAETKSKNFEMPKPSKQRRARTQAKTKNGRRENIGKKERKARRTENRRNQKMKNEKSNNQGNKTIFTFFGAPGSGKGTLAELCINNLGYKVLSTGNLCRENIANQTEVGKKVEVYTKVGQLVPDDLIIDMVKNWLNTQKDASKPIVLDGFPRTKAQAEKLNSILKDEMPDYKFRIVALDIPQEEIVQRLGGRRVCPNKDCQGVYNISMPEIKDGVCPKCKTELITRNDDKEDVIKDRFTVYKKHETELLDFYKSSGNKIETLNISKISPKEVFENFKKIV